LETVEALPSQVLQVVAKGQRGGKGHILLSDQTTKGHIGSPKGTVSFSRGLARTDSGIIIHYM